MDVSLQLVISIISGNKAQNSFCCRVQYKYGHFMAMEVRETRDVLS